MACVTEVYVFRLDLRMLVVVVLVLVLVSVVLFDFFFWLNADAKFKIACVHMCCMWHFGICAQLIMKAWTFPLHPLYFFMESFFGVFVTSSHCQFFGWLVG